MNSGTIHLTCPYCQEMSLYLIQNDEGEQLVECSWCEKEFIAVVEIFVDATTKKKVGI